MACRAKKNDEVLLQHKLSFGAIFDSWKNIMHGNILRKKTYPLLSCRPFQSHLSTRTCLRFICNRNDPLGKKNAV